MNPYVFRNICDVQKYVRSVDGSSSTTSAIEAFAVFASGAKSILTLACGEDLLFLTPSTDDSIDDDYTIRKFQWPRERQGKNIACMTFSPCGRWLASVSSTGSIEIVPTSLALHTSGISSSHVSPLLFSITELSTIDLRVRDDCLGLPTCVVWYETKQKRHMLVYSNKGGDIFFVDLAVRRLSASLQAPQSIHNLEIIEEAAHDDVYLLVSGFAGTQWLVPLEQRNMTLRETLARIVPSELKELNVRGLVNAVKSGGCNCLGVLYEDTFRLFNTTNFGTPILDLLLPEGSFAVRYTDVLTFSVHKQILVSYSFNCCSTADYAPETREQFTSIIGQLPECRFIGFVAFPQSDDVGLPSCLFITETSVFLAAPKWTTREYLANLLLTEKKLTLIELYCQAVGLNFQTSCFDAIPSLLERNAVDRALQICNLSKAPLYAIAKQFVERGFSSFILPQINSWLSGSPGKTSSASEQSKKELSSLAFELLVETCRNSEGFEKNKADQNLKNFLLHNVWYDAEYCMKTLLKLRMYDSALSVVKVHGLYESLAKEIITMDAWTETDDAFLSLISLPGLGSVLLDARSTYCHHYLARLEKLFTNINRNQRTRFLALFDPDREEMTKLLESANVKKFSADKNVSSTRSLLEDVVNFFLSSLMVYLYDPSNASVQDDSTDAIANSKSIQSEAQETVPIACGAEHVCVLSSDGFVYAFGRTRHGCLGDRAETTSPTSAPVPVVIPLKLEVIQVACGSDHTICVTKTGSIFAWGSNKYGQLGIGREIPQSSKPTSVVNFTSSTIMKIETGQYHSFALDVSGRPYGWGWNVHRQLGVGDLAEDIYKPKPVTFFEKIRVKSISCGYAHTIFLTEKGFLYGCGNNSYGQLALDDVKKTTMPTRLRIVSKCQPPVNGQDDDSFELIATGFFHNIAVSKKRRMFTWGATPQSLKFKALLQKRKHQQQPATTAAGSNAAPIVNASDAATGGAVNGLVDTKQLHPTQVDLTEVGEKKIVQLACGFHHCLLRTEDGRLYTWGKNFEFQLGHADKKERVSPTLVTSICQPIAYATCGSDFTIVVDANRLLWGWGKNDSSQLGFESLASSERSTLAGRVLTIQRPNKGGQRTIQLPQDSRTYVSKPVRIAGLRSVWPLEGENEMEERVRRKYSQLFLIGSLKKLRDYYRPQEILERCNQLHADGIASFIQLLHGDVELSCRMSLDALTKSIHSDHNRINEILSFYVDLAENCALDTSKTVDLLRIVFQYSSFYRSRNFNLDTFVEKNMNRLAPAVVKLLIENPKSVPLGLKLKLKAAQFVNRNSGQPSNLVNGNYAHVSQDDVINAAGTGDRYCYKYSCGHVIGEGIIVSTLNSLSNDIILHRSPRVAESVQSYIQNVANMPCDMCPICLKADLGRIFTTTLSQ